MYVHIHNPHSLGVGLRTSARRFGVFFLCGWAFLSEVSADTLVIRFPSYYGTSLFEQDGTTALSAGSLVQVGSFNITDTELVSTPGLTSAAVVTAGGRFSEYTNFNLTAGQLAGTEFFPRVAGEDEDGNEIFDPFSLPSMDSLQGRRMYLIFYNAATAAAATELAIFRYLTPTDLIIGSQGVFPTAGNPAASNERDTSFLMNPSNLSLLIGQNVNGQLRLGSISNGIGQITSPLTETNASGAVSNYQITANNGADRFFATTNTANADLTLTTLPTGFSIATNTGVITAGTNAAANTYSIRLVASNSLTASVATNTLTWTLQASSLSFTTTTNLISAVAGVQISPFTFVSTGTSPTYTADGNLRGLILSTNGLLSGIPSSVGTNDVTITSSAGGQNGTTTFSLAVAAPTISVPAGELMGGQIVHIAGTARTVTLSKSAGFTDLTGQVSPSTSGVTFNGTDLVIAADAVPLLKGLNNINLTLTASKVGVSGASASTTVALRIVAPTPTRLVGPTEFEVDVGQAFSAMILSDAGTYGRMSFSNLPSGLLGNQNGVVAGTNSSTNLPYEFPVRVVADSTQIYEGGGTYTNTNVIFRLRNTNAPYFSRTNENVLASPGRPISPIQLVASNFPSRYSTPTLPPGLQRAGNTITGTPTSAGRFEVPVVAYNSYRPGSTNPADEQMGTNTLILTIRVDSTRPTSVVPTTPGTITRNTTINTSDDLYLIPGGVENAGVRVATYGLPPGISLDPTTGKLFGTTGGPGSYTATVFIQNGRGWIKRTITLTVQ
jgi:hypothetical protein